MTLVNGVLVQAPVKQSDIQGALGVSSSVNKWSQLCTHGNINKWAKYKPISYNTTSNLTLAQRQLVNYGITNIPVWSGRSGAPNHMGNFWFGVDTSDNNLPSCGRVQTGYWWYQRPTGGASSPYRELDFNGYKHDVVAPIGGCTSGTLYITATGNLEISFSGNGSGQSDGYTVPLSELSAGVTFGNLYMSVMIRKVGSSTYYAASRDNRWSESPDTSVTKKVTAAIGNALSGSCEVFPFLSMTKFDTFTSNFGQDQGPVVAMFEKSAVNVMIQKAKAEPSGFSAWYVNASDKVLHASFTLTNTSAADFTASYTVYFSASPTFPDSDTVSVSGDVSIKIGKSVDCSVNPTIWTRESASYYRNGYARLSVTIAPGEVIFYESTSAAASIVWQNDPSPTPFD